jgi:hypothetical protein
MKQKTPMQELLEWVRATLPMDLDTPRLIEQKIESMLEKEKEVLMRTYQDGLDNGFANGNWDLNLYYNETFKTK